MAVVLRAELKLRDGEKRTVQTQTRTGIGTGALQNPGIPALVSALRELSKCVSCLLTELVQQEQSQSACATELCRGDDDEDDDEEDDDDDEEDPCDSEPQLKRTKTKPQ